MPRLVMVFMIQTKSKPNLEKEMALAGVAAHSASSRMATGSDQLTFSEITSMFGLCRSVGRKRPYDVDYII